MPITLNRRKIMLTAMAGSSGMLLNGALGSYALAQAPAPAPTSNAGYYMFQIGDIRATVLSDGLIGGLPRVFASDAPEQELQAVLQNAFLPLDNLVLNLNTLLVEINGTRVLLEAGGGQTMGPNGGRIFASLASIGLTADDIDIIVVSHTHPDHVGNLRAADGTKAFPNATVFAPRADWDFFVTGDPDLSFMPVPADFALQFAAAIKTSFEPVLGEIELYEPGAEIVPGLTILDGAGHTPGMVAFLVQSGTDQLLLTSDLAYHPLVNIDNPWLPGPDRDPDTALASRRRVFDMAAADRMLVLGFHYPFPGLGRMLKVDTGYAWVPAHWQF